MTDEQADALLRGIATLVDALIANTSASINATKASMDMYAAITGMTDVLLQDGSEAGSDEPTPAPRYADGTPIG